MHTRGNGLKEGRGDRKERQVSKEMFVQLPAPTTAYSPNLSPQHPLALAGPFRAHSALHPPEGPPEFEGTRGEGEAQQTPLEKPHTKAEGGKERKADRQPF